MLSKRTKIAAKLTGRSGSEQ